jgi:hypothetical protein
VAAKRESMDGIAGTLYVDAADEETDWRRSLNPVGAAVLGRAGDVAA